MRTMPIARTMLTTPPMPNNDNGCDVSDYQAISLLFRTMADVDALIEQTKTRDIKIVLDLVINHSSDEHAWFQ